MKQTIPKKLASGMVAAAMTLSLLPAAALAADSEYSASGATGFAFTDSGIAAEDGSYTGYKISDTDLTIRGLTLNITAPVNDAINAEQTLNIESGTLNISSGDDAIHCDYVMNVGASGTMGPSITIKACYEGLEAATLNILSGNISILSEDECLNAANSDLTGYSFSIKDSSDNTLYSGTATCSASYVFFSSSKLIASGSYSLYSGSTAAATATAQTGTSFGSMTGGQRSGGQQNGSGAPSTLPGGTNGQQPPAQPDGSDSSNGSSAPQPVQSSGFTDVAASDWFYSAVLRYAYENGLMTGTGSGAFSPNATITRGMLVTIFYRLENEPAVTAANPFTDVSSGSYCEKAAAWAAANGISGSLLSPKGTATRAQTAMILMRFCQKV